MMAEPAPGARRPGRPSKHVAPGGLYETAQHYVGDLVYGANDGILTTFGRRRRRDWGRPVGDDGHRCRRGQSWLPTGCRWAWGTTSAFAPERARSSDRDGLRKKPSRHDTDSRRFWPSSSPGPVPLVPYLVPGAGGRIHPGCVPGVRCAVRRGRRTLAGDRQPMVDQRSGNARTRGPGRRRGVCDRRRRSRCSSRTERGEAPRESLGRHLYACSSLSCALIRRARGGRHRPRHGAADRWLLLAGADRRPAQRDVVGPTRRR